MIRVVLPFHLQRLAHCKGETIINIEGPATLRSVLDALEAQYPALSGTIRDYATQQRRPLLRFYACRKDLSHESLDSPLPETVASGEEPLLIIGAIAGG
jgi:sulfur-carrier protein